MRTNKVILIAGTRGTGKTDFVKNLLAQMESVFSKCLVVDTFDNPVWLDLSTHDHPERMKLVPVINSEQLPRLKKGTARIFNSDTNGLVAEIERTVRNTFVVFEDATRYIGSRLTDEMRRFVLDSKQKNTDLVFVFHNLTAIPPELVRISDILVLFKTNEGRVNEAKYPWAEIPETMEQLRSSQNRYEHKIIQLQ